MQAARPVQGRRPRLGAAGLGLALALLAAPFPGYAAPEGGGAVV
jgi:hypothetical protein